MLWEHKEGQIQRVSRRKWQLKGDPENNWELTTGHGERFSREETAQVKVKKVNDSMWSKNAGWPLSQGSTLEDPALPLVSECKLIRLRLTVTKLTGGQVQIRTRKFSLAW